MSFITGFGATILVAIPYVLGTILDGLALTYLWRWFVAAQFQLPPLGIAQAIGLALLVRYVTHQDVDVPEVERTVWDRAMRLLGALLVRPCIILAMGYVVSLFL